MNAFEYIKKYFVPVIENKDEDIEHSWHFIYKHRRLVGRERAIAKEFSLAGMLYGIPIGILILAIGKIITDVIG